MQTFFYSVLHFLTDGLCAFALFARFSESGDFALYVLLYDFCAFVLQMPFGAVMDSLKMRMPEKAVKLPYFCALLGAALTAAGAFLHPVILGLGNALFHVGGGIGTIAEDREKDKKGAALGIFVAPGAMGLYLGTVYGQAGNASLNRLVLLIAAAVYLLLFLIFGVMLKKHDAAEDVPETRIGYPDHASRFPQQSAPAVTAAALCFLVVILRSFAGFSIAFSWKEGFLFGFLCTLAVVLGKMAGGILTARFGAARIMTVSLILSAIGYFFSDLPAAGIFALLFFNMTMPVTLYMIADRFRGLEGFSFGLLTAALFLGALPSFLGLPQMPGRRLGTAVSLLSLALLLASVCLLKKEKTWTS